MTEPQAQGAETKAPEVIRRTLLKNIKSCWGVLVGIGPVATLVSILLVNYQSCRSYDLSKDAGRPCLYAREVFPFPYEPGKFGVAIVNAGSRPAHVVEHGAIRLVLPEGQAIPDVGDVVHDTGQRDDIIAKEYPISYTFPPFTIVDGSVISAVRSLDEMRATLKTQKARAFLMGKLRYLDGMEEHWFMYCKVLTGDIDWQACPKPAGKL